MEHRILNIDSAEKPPAFLTEPAAFKPKSKHIPELDGLRGLLAWWVVIHHILLSLGYTVASFPGGRLILRGDYAVDVFIILSGFVIFKLLADSCESYRTFLTRRFFRLYPAFAVCLVAVLLLRPAIWSVLQHAPMGDPKIHQLELKIWASEQAHFGSHLIAHLTLLHSVIPDSVMFGSAFAFLGTAWSLSLEWQFYLVAPLISAILMRFRQVGLLVFMAISVYCFSRFSEGLIGFLPDKLLYFAVGIVSFYYLPHAARGKVADLLLLGVAPILLALNLPLAIWCAAMAATLADEEGSIAGRLRAGLNMPVMQHLGRISYSTYLGHQCVIWALQWIIFARWPGVSQRGMLAILLPTTIIGTYVASALMYRFVELPGIALGKRFSKKRA